MRRLLSVLAALGMVASTFGLSNVMPVAHGDLAWCFDDPVVLINGHTVNITVAMWLSGAGHVNKHVPVAIIVPDGVSHSIVQNVPGEFFTNDVQFFALSHASDAAAFLGVSIDSLDLPHGHDNQVSDSSHDHDDQVSDSSHDHNNQVSDSSHDHDNQVYVYSIIRGDPGIGTSLFTGKFAHLTVRQTQELMSIKFGLWAANE